MSELKLQGKIVKIFPTVEVTQSFKKREFVIATEEKYPQVVKFELTQNKCEDLDNYKVGQLVDVFFNVRGREHTPPGKDHVQYFTTLQVWRIVSLHQQQENKKIIETQEAATFDSDFDSETLPF